MNGRIVPLGQLLDFDDIPGSTGGCCPYTGTFSGTAGIKRGLYRFADGRTANADINGAANHAS